MHRRHKISSKFVDEIVRHTNSHNKLQEESVMWKQRKLEREDKEKDDPRRQNQHRDVELKRLQAASSQSRLISRQLLEAKSAAGKWDHSGFATLYPDEIYDEKKEKEEDKEKPSTSSQKKKTRSISPSSSSSSTSTSSKVEEKKKRKKKRSISPSSSSSSVISISSSSSDARRRKSRSKKHKKNKKKKSHHKHDKK